MYTFITSIINIQFEIQKWKDHILFIYCNLVLKSTMLRPKEDKSHVSSSFLKSFTNLC